MLTVEEHAALHVRAFATDFGKRLREAVASAAVSGLALDASAPVTRDEERRKAVRDMLRHGGYKPTGRGKPASEYLVKAAEAGKLDSINAAVDACNATSLHSGFPISVVDLDRAVSPFRIAIAPPGTEYVFNASGQTIDLAGLVCLFDQEGACGNAVKDSQRTKTHDETSRTLSVLWGCAGHAEALDAALAWYRELLADAGASTELVRPSA